MVHQQFLGQDGPRVGELGRVGDERARPGGEEQHPDPVGQRRQEGELDLGVVLVGAQDGDRLGVHVRGPARAVRQHHPYGGRGALGVEHGGQTRGRLEGLLEALDVADAGEQKRPQPAGRVGRAGVDLPAPPGLDESVGVDHPGRDTVLPGAGVDDLDRAAVALGLLERPQRLVPRRQLGLTAGSADHRLGQHVDRGSQVLVGLDVVQRDRGGVDERELGRVDVLHPELLGRAVVDGADDLRLERVDVAVAVGPEELQHRRSPEAEHPVVLERVRGVERQQVLAQLLGRDVDLVGQRGQRHAVGMGQQHLEHRGQPAEAGGVLGRGLASHRQSPPFSSLSSASSSRRTSSGPTSTTRRPSS